MSRSNPKRAPLQTLKPRIQVMSDNRLAVMQLVNGTPRDRGRPWRRKRAAWLREHPLCCACLAMTPQRVTEAVECDHVRALADGGVDDASNFQSLCGPHHRDKCAREATERARGLGCFRSLQSSPADTSPSRTRRPQGIFSNENSRNRI